MVPQHKEAGIREGAREFAEDGYAERQTVAVDRSARADQDHPGKFSRRVRRARQRSGQREPVGWHGDAFIIRPRNGDGSRGDRGDVLAHDFDRLTRGAEPDHPAGLVGPDGHVDRFLRQRQRQPRPARRNQPRSRLYLFGGRFAHTRGERRSRHGIDGKERPDGCRAEPRGERFVGTEKTVRQDEHRGRINRIGLLARLAADRDL